MEEMIEKLTTEVIEKVSGYSWMDQAAMLEEISERLRFEAYDCVKIEYGLTDLNEDLI